jgi:ferredoxin-type protein NapH
MNAPEEQLTLAAPRSLLARNRWLLARRSVQIGILVLFLAGPWLGVWWLKGNLASSTFFDVVGLTDPLVLLQSLVAGHKLALPAVIGALSVLAVYFVVGGRVYCSWVCPINIVTDAAFWLRGKLRINASWQPRRAHASDSGDGAGGVAAHRHDCLGAGQSHHDAAAGLVFGMGSLVVLAVFLFDLAVSRRGWCSYICPVGAFYGTVGRLSLLRVSAVKRQACTDCGDCYRVCPEPHVIVPALKPADPKASPVIVSGDCTNCGRCIDVCADDVFRFGTRFAKLS